jgi:hypothetical protein
MRRASFIGDAAGTTGRPALRYASPVEGAPLRARRPVDCTNTTINPGGQFYVSPGGQFRMSLDMTGGMISE